MKVGVWRFAAAPKFEEKIMSQNQQYKKVKLYRVLKTVFYALGLPLFLVAVFFAAVKFLGHDPFVGESDATLFSNYFRMISSPALYGIWIAAGIWAFIAIVQIVVGKLLKNRRVRMLVVVAVTLVAMLGTMCIMDISLANQLDEIAANAPAGVVVNDYKTQLSYYRTITKGYENSDATRLLIDKIDLLKKVYNVKMEGEDKGGVAGNIANPGVYYDTIIADDGTVGIDISFDENGKVVEIPDGNPANDHILIRKAPDSYGNLTFSTEATGGVPRTYSHYVAQQRTAVSGMVATMWYTKDMMAASEVPENGKYGKAIYNSNGMLNDGWVPSLYNVLDILEAYYGGLAAAEAAVADKDCYYQSVDEAHPEIIEAAQQRREYFYTVTCLDEESKDYNPWLASLYQQEVQFTKNFSLPHGRLDALVAELGAMLGSNKLFDYLFSPDALIGSIISPIISPLKNGKSLKEFLQGQFGLDDNTWNTVLQVVQVICGDDTITDAYLTVFYPSAEDKLLDPDSHFYIGLKKNDANGETILDIDFSNALIGGDDENPDYAFDLDHLSAFLNTTLNRVIDHFGVDLKSGILNTVLGLFIKNGTLTIGGVSIPLFDDQWNFNIDVSSIISGLLDSLYFYRSAALKPIYDFYQDSEASESEQALQLALAEYDRAYYEGALHGALLGSVMIGDTLGAGTYASSFGLADLQSVQQVKTDLSYARVFYPLYSFRDMLMLFTGLVVLFMFLSYIAAEKEEEYATGTAIIKEKKKKQDEVCPEDPDDLVMDETEADNAAQESSDAPATDSTDNADVPATDTSDSADVPATEDTVLPVDENTQKEVQ